MKQTAMPFYETDVDATNSAIMRSTKSFKDVACVVRPDIHPDSAYAWLKNALRGDAREKLSGDQHLLIANTTGEFDFLYYCAQKCHHSRPEPIEPESEAVALERSIDEQLKKLNGLLELRGRVQLRTVNAT